MPRRLSVVGHPISLADLFIALFKKRNTACRQFCQQIKDEAGVKHGFLLNSGVACFYTILSALKKLHRGKEVVLPSYTASSLIIAIQRAGLKPVLCDISLDDFNADLSDMLRRINENTLCVVAVHMFGIPWRGIEELNSRRKKSNIFVIEDCAQSFGAKLSGVSIGIFGDVGFFSFNRGKNLPVLEGGCIVTQSEELASAIERESSSYTQQGFDKRIVSGFKLFALSFAFRPFFYWLLRSLIERFKELPADPAFQVYRCQGYLAAVGLRLFKKMRKPFQKRKVNSQKMFDALKSVKGVRLPKISEDVLPLFNRLPVIIEEKEKIEGILRSLDKAGIEASRFYLKPLHHLFKLGYEEAEFPNSVYFAERLLTLPVHPYVTDRDIMTMVGLIKQSLESS